MKNTENKPQDFRRTWDKDEYRQKYKNKKTAETAVPLSLTTAREQVELDHLINKSVLISAAAESTLGFHCHACDMNYKDNLSYLEHLNSPLHLLKIGQFNKVEKSTVQQVKARLEARKNRTAALRILNLI